MADFEIASQITQYEAMFHRVGSNGIAGEFYLDLAANSIESVKSLVAEEKALASGLAWVDLTKKAVVKIRHSEERSTRPYGLPDYPLEELEGRRVSSGSSYFVTDRNDQGLIFTPFTEVLAQTNLTDYMGRWMGAIAASSHFPSFWTQLSGRVSKEMREAHYNPDNDAF